MSLLSEGGENNVRNTYIAINDKYSSSSSRGLVLQKMTMQFT